MTVRHFVSPVGRLQTWLFGRGVAGNRWSRDAFFAVITIRALRDMARRRPQTLALDKLAPGEGIRVTTAPRDRVRSSR